MLATNRSEVERMMDEVMITLTEKPELNDPVLIEGLPGVGNVGKLAAEHLLDELETTKFGDIYSRHFPPQVLVEEDGVIKLVNNELYYYKRGEGDEPGPDIVFLVGDYQGISSEGQYILTERVLDMAQDLGVKMVFTLGGYGLGRMVENPRVLGAATSHAVVSDMKKVGVVFQKGEPVSGIVGASGLLLGLGRIRNVEGICLMGETSGYFVDPKSAQAVLEVLTNILKISVSFSELEDKALQIDKITSQLKELEGTGGSEGGSEDLRYIG